MRSQSVCTRGKTFKGIIGSEQAYFTKNIWVIGVIWKAWITPFTWGMGAMSAIGSGYVTAQNVELTCLRPAQLKNMLKK